MTKIGTATVEPPLIVVAAALIDGAGRVLIQQRAPGRAMAGLWEFPGGKIDLGETPVAALARELREELAIVVEEGALRPLAFSTGSIGERVLILLLYLCRDWRGDPVALDAAAIAWREVDDLDADVMPPADRPLLDALRRLAVSRS